MLGDLEEEVPRILGKLEDEIADDEEEQEEEQPAIDLEASPAAKFLLHFTPWELAPSPLPLATIPASVPFLWEDFPGKPKPPQMPSPFHSLPLPPRLASPATASAKASDAKTLSSLEPHGRHKNNSHSWHVLQNFFSSHLRHSSHDEDAMDVVGSDSPLQFQQTESSKPATRTQNHKESLSSNSGKEPSFDPASVPDAVAQDANANSEARSKIDYQLPSPYVATIVPLTSPYRDLGPTNDDDSTSSRKCLSTGSSFKCLASIFRRIRGKGIHLRARGASSSCFASSNYSTEGNSYLLEDTEKRPRNGEVHRHNWAEDSPSFGTKSDVPRYRSSRRGKRTYQSKGGGIRVRRRGCRLFVSPC